MISVEQATHIIDQHLFHPGIESISLDKSLGRILAENVSADRDFPPFDRVAMDGICFRYEDFQKGQKQFPISGVQAAGESPLNLAHGTCLEIMTGAALSNGADTVIRYEDLDIKDGLANIQIEDVRFGQNVHKQGSDRKSATVLLEANERISATTIGVLATVGKAQVRVFKQPKVAIVSTGDELVDVDKTPLPHQIRKSNVHSLMALLSTYGIEPELVHLADDKGDISNRIADLLEKNDAILMSGAVSKGKFDFLPEVLSDLGVVKQFHKVEQRPGKPFWFGTKGKTSVFAFPGNPVSTFVCAKRFFEPWLKKSYHQLPEKQYAVLGEDVSFRPNLTYFLQVQVKNLLGKLIAAPAVGNGSGDLANLTVANAFMELPSTQVDFKAGEVYPIWMF